MNGASSSPDWPKLVTQFGIPTVFAGVLLWFVLIKLGNALDGIVGEMREQTRVLQAIEQMVSRRNG